MLGTFVLSAGYHDAYFTKAQKIRRLIKNKTDEMFERFDFVISPTSPHTPFSIGQKHKDPTIMYLEDIFTVQANLAGNPAITLPLGKHSNGLPIGLHLMADNFNEAALISFSKYLSKYEIIYLCYVKVFLFSTFLITIVFLCSNAASISVRRALVF